MRGNLFKLIETALKLIFILCWTMISILVHGVKEVNQVEDSSGDGGDPEGAGCFKIPSVDAGVVLISVVPCKATHA